MQRRAPVLLQTAPLLSLIAARAFEHNSHMNASPLALDFKLHQLPRSCMPVIHARVATHGLSVHVTVVQLLLSFHARALHTLGEAL